MFFIENNLTQSGATKVAQQGQGGVLKYHKRPLLVKNWFMWRNISRIFSCKTVQSENSPDMPMAICLDPQVLKQGSIFKSIKVKVALGQS